MSRKRSDQRRKLAGLTCGQMLLVFLGVAALGLLAALAFGYSLGVFDRILPTTAAPPSPTSMETPIPALQTEKAQVPVSPAANTALPLHQATGEATATVDRTVAVSPTTTPSPMISLTPPGDVCSRLDLRFLSATSNVAAWRLQNSSGTALRLNRIEIEWPGTNDAIFNAFLDGKVIWSGVDQVSPTFITSWSGPLDDRTLHSLSRLEFLFGTTAASGGYHLKLQFENGCELSHAN